MSHDTDHKRALLLSLLSNKQQNSANTQSEIAIIGVNGRFPGAENLEQFWANLSEAKNSISEVPADRWDWQSYNSEHERDKSQVRAGFIRDVDKFDPLFFGISPREADRMDPQERLFLECAWHTVEDAGYTPEGLSANNQRVGVFAGAMNANYSIWGSQNWEDNRNGNRVYACNPTFWSISNRVSYTLDFNGPSFTVDSACSSSLTAIHLACESIRRGECEVALAGGVNLILHPAQLDSLSKMNMLSKTGNCHTFGANADGFTDGEGVGSVLLKPLQKAIADNDSIYGVIAASGLNSGGRTSGYTVPNPNAQADLIENVIQRAGIDPQDISYIEAHGTGTALGDPIEVRGLSKAFEKYTSRKNFCAIGSVKSNIGHLESAAGVSALTKVLLQFKHHKLVPSINAETINPNICFENTAFYLQNRVRELPQDRPLYAGISSFGAGGANTHLIIKNHIQQADISAPEASQPQLIFLSAQTSEQLKQSANALLEYIQLHQHQPELTLDNIAFTLTVGRIELNNRLAMVAFNLNDLIEKLNHFVSSNSHRADVFHGEASEVCYPEPTEINSSNLDILNTLAQRWVKGEIERPTAIFPQQHARRLSLPGYPFARERYWIQTSDNRENCGTQTGPVKTVVSATPDMLYFSSKWSESPLANKKSQTEYEHEHKVFFVEDETTAKLIDKTSEHTWLFPVNSKLNTSNQLSTNSKKEYYAALDNYLAAHQANLHFIYAWTNNSSHDNYQGLRALLWLTQYILDKGLDSRASLTVWHETKGNLEDLHGSAYAGFIKSLHLEKPHFSVKHLSFISRNAQPVSLETQFTQLQTELCNDNPEVIVKYDNGKRFVEKVNLQSNVTEARNNPAVAHSGGTYLITGGAGGLGRIIARQFAKTGHLNLVLTGRSELDDDKQALLDELRKYDNEAVYFPCDVTDKYDVVNLFEKITGRFGSLNGLIHSAGVLNDCLVQNKQWPEFHKVAITKTQAVVNLDAASEGQALDFFVTFSSISAMLGNVGQTDYAYANSYMDNFIQWRNNLEEIGERQGRGVTINWPIWSEGGMHISPAILKAIEEQIGVLPLQTPMGLQSFSNILNSPVTQVAPVFGYADRIIQHLNSVGCSDINPHDIKPSGVKPQAIAVDLNTLPNTKFQLRETLVDELTDLTSQVLDITSERIHCDTVLGDFGFDSITLREFSHQLKVHFSIDVSPAVFFSKNTLAKLANYILENHEPALTEKYADELQTQSAHSSNSPSMAMPNGSSPMAQQGALATQRGSIDEIAIIGAAGILPGARNLDEFWDNLENSVDSISEIPENRWCWQDYYGDAFGTINKSNSKWGGFITDVDKFDFAFFDVSQREADFMDPQQRLFLQTTWHALENAGYDPTAFAGQNVGVFSGVEFSDYKDLLDQYGQFHAEMPIGNAHNMIPNRVSYFLDLRGPSEAIDTACSSSLIAINRAMRSLQSGESSLAIAGGVSLTLSPKTMIGTSQLNIYSPDGQCKTLDETANGYVKGEGVGVIIMKPLQQAIADSDNILAVIKNCSVNHGGRSNSITAPNPDAQSELLFNAYHNADIDPSRIAYIEMHGTGTNLGDPVEVEGIKGAFQKLAKIRGTRLTDSSCGIGSVKTNIGHLEPAAGIAGVLKMILALKHKKIPASLHFNKLNPLISFSNSPLYVVDKLQALPEDVERPVVVGVSSFGFGGSNAHIVLEQWLDEQKEQSKPAGESFIVPLSAKTPESLKDVCQQLIAYNSANNSLSLDRLAYTLQTGRTAFDHRFVCVATNFDELQENLRAYIEGSLRPRCFTGNKKDNAPLLDDLKATDFHTHLLEKKDVHLLAKWWAKGLDIDWHQHYTGLAITQLEIPGYPFAKVRCWLPDTHTTNTVPVKKVAAVNVPDEPKEEIQSPQIESAEPQTNRIAVHILDRVAELSGKAKAEIKAGNNLALDLGLDSIKMMGLINELISISSAERVRSFNKLGMNTIINKARTFGELVKIFSDADAADTNPTLPSSASRIRNSVAILDSQAVFIPAYFLTKSSSLCSYIEIQGDLDVGLANRAWKTLVEKHPALQLQFHWPVESPKTLGGIYASFVKDCSNLEIAITDICDLSKNKQAHKIEEFFHERLNRTWPLDKWPLHSFELLRCSEDHHVLFWSNEHIISDGLSNQTALRNFLNIYEALKQGNELPSNPLETRDQYLACVNKINSAALNNSADDISPLKSTNYVFNPEGSIKNIAKSHFNNIAIALDTEKTEKLKKAAAQYRINLNTLLTYMFTKTVERFDAESPSILVQVPTSGRSYEGVETADAIGCFAQNLTMEINPVQEFEALTHQIEETLQSRLIADIDKQQTRALRSMISEFPLGTDNSLPQHTLEMLLDNVKSNLYFPFTGETGIENRYDSLCVSRYRAGTSNSPGAIDFLQEIHNEQLHIFINYDVSFFSAALIEELSQYYLSCVDEVLDNSDAYAPIEHQQRTESRSSGADSKLQQAMEQITGKKITSQEFDRDLEWDIGVDSLVKIRLIGHLNTLFDHRINKASLARCRTLSEMSHILEPNLNSASGRTTQIENSTCVPDNLGVADLPISRIIQQCLATPDATAVTHFNGESITYRELHENSNRIANLLIDRGVKNGDYVGLITHRGPKMITAIVAVLKCGAAYVPMDPIFPADRKAYIVNHARIKTILSESALITQLVDLQNAQKVTQNESFGRLVLIDEHSDKLPTHLNSDRIDCYHKSDWEDYPASLPRVEIAPEDDMVVLFTSGSTGNPKGVYLHHLGYANRIIWHQNTFKLTAGEKVAQKTSCSFDVSIWEHLWPIMYGGVVCAVEKDTVTNPWEFADWLIRENISVAHFVPSMFGEFVNAIAEEGYQFPSLRWLIFSGEALPTATVQNWIDGFGLKVGLCNLYGPTEASIDVTYHTITKRPEDNEAIPIGKAVDNTVLFVRGENGERLAVGEMGELMIAGKQLAKGYLYEPELTAKAFIPNEYRGVPGDFVYRTGDLAVEKAGGVFEYHGRLDSQVKLRGFRVELGEIENVAASHPHIEEAAVLVIEEELTLWYSGTPLSEDEIKQYIGNKCPSYMVPQIINHYPRLPKNNNGKLDRKALLKGDVSPPEILQASASNKSQIFTRLPLLPAQNWIFSYFDSPYEWWGASQQTLPADFNLALFSKALTIIVDRHEALRARFVKTDNGHIEQELIANPGEILVEQKSLSLSSNMFNDEIQRNTRSIAHSLSPYQWPLFRVITFSNSQSENTGNTQQKLVWVAHHLISDMLSGFIVNQEVWQVYLALAEGSERPELPVAPQLSDYICGLQNYFNDKTLAHAKDYWQKYSKKFRSVIQIPTDHSLGGNVESSSDSVKCLIPAELVNLLETDGRDYFETSLYNMLAATLYKLTAQLTRRSWIVISHKLNGRVVPSATVNFFTSVGNFAVNVPVGISIQKSANFNHIISQLSIEMEELPAKGLGYDWLAADLPIDIYPDNKLTSIRINYLGDISNNAAGDGVSERIAPQNQQRTAVLEFFFYTQNQEMYLEISYSRNLYARETIEALAGRYLDQLTSLSDEIVPELFHTN